MSNPSMSTSLTRKSLSAVFRSLTTTYTATCMSAWKGGMKTSFPELSYETDPTSFAVDYLAYNLTRKMEDDVWGTAPSQKALELEAVSGFLAVEQRMARLNREGIRSDSDFSSGQEPTVAAVIHTARRKISKVLSDFDPNEMNARASFSSGASTRLPRRSGAPHNKFSGKPHVTRNCALLSLCSVWHSPIWRESCHAEYGRESDPCTWIQVVPGSVYFTVPKTTHAVRGAAKEPDLNLYLQKGIGKMIRSRLKRVRIDLDDQSLNQELALIGSRTGSLSTIDLSSASDSISLELCRELLPEDWFRFIRLTRSEYVTLPDGSLHELAKVSSMGNGFTFELESLLFWGLTAACVELLEVEDKRIGVYGDDIVCHHTATHTLIKVLEACGFEVNTEKSFVSGPFRESCGKHYFLGVDVSPFNVKHELSDASERYHLINRLRLWSHRLDVDLDKLVKYLIRTLLPRGYTCVPPDRGTKAGMLVPSVGHAIGVYWCFAAQAYVTRALVSKTPQYQPSCKTALWVWYMNAGEGNPLPRFSWLRGSLQVRTPKRTARGENVEDTRLRRVVTSRWADCEISLLPNIPGHSESAGNL